MQLLPALLGVQPDELSSDQRQLLSHSVKTGGMGIQNPLDTAPRVHQVSLAATKHLTTSLVNDKVSFDLQLHTKTARTASHEAHRARIEDEMIALTRRGQGNALVGRRDKRNCSNGAWLTVVPTTLNDTYLEKNEWRDSARLRNNLAPMGMQSHCDGCGAGMSVEHAMSCKKGGLVNARHNILWHNLLAIATTPSGCTREPGQWQTKRRQVLLHFLHKLPLLQKSAATLAATPSGPRNVIPYLTCESLILTPRPIGQSKSPSS